MPHWELSARLLAGKGLSHFARKGNLLIGGFQCKSETRESFVETCVYHGAVVSGVVSQNPVFLSKVSESSKAPDKRARSVASSKFALLAASRRGPLRPLAGAGGAGYGGAGDELHDHAAGFRAAFRLHNYIAAAAAQTVAHPVGSLARPGRARGKE